MYSYPSKTSKQNNKMNKIRSSQIKIEYEKIPENLNSQLILSDENDNENFNVYFMKTDIKYKTISNSNSLTSSKIKKLNSQIKKEQKNEKEFKSHLIKKLKSLKLNQKNKDKIPLNIASMNPAGLLCIFSLEPSSKYFLIYIFIIYFCRI